MSDDVRRLAFMPDDEIDPEEYARYEVFTQVYMRSGWNRYLPIGAIEVIPQFCEADRLTLGELNARIPRSGALAHSAWDEVKVWTADDRAFLDEHGDADKTIDEVNAEEQRIHAETVAEFEKYADALGVPHVRTLFDVLTFAIACRVVTATKEDGETWLALNPQAPLPAEVLPLSEDERQKEDEIRWRRLNEDTVQAIIGLFRPDDEDALDVKKTSLERLARELDVPVDTARAGVACLIEDPDFSANRDPETLREHEVFEIRVDWEKFGETRMSIRFAQPEDDE